MHDLVVRDLERARNRTLGLTDLDDPTLVPDARLNLLLTGGRRIIATRWNDTLSILRTGGGFVVASEPYDDDPGWADVPDHHRVDVADGVVTVTELEA
jgi:gamma-glutamyl hercynylcysteine S-oxide hydrolase